MVTSQQPAPVQISTTMYIILGLTILVALIVIIQVVYVRMKLGEYANDEYYKKMLVKNEYADIQFTNNCSNMGIYGLEIDSELTVKINTSGVKLLSQTAFDLPSFHYTIPVGDKFTSVEFNPSDFTTIALIFGSAALRLTNDIAARKVDYVTWGQSLYRIVHFPNYASKVADVKDTQNRVYIGLISVPSIEELMRANNISSSNSTLSLTNQPAITSFLTSSTHIPLDLSKIPKTMQVIGYRI